MKSIVTSLIFLLFVFDCSGQDICSGNLGENIFERGDFGSGTAPILTTNPNIAPGYNYTTSVPQDGSYVICSNTAALNGLYPTWISVEDNSSDPNGYMMVVNASYEPGIFYEEEVSGLCENTLYEFSADILNLIRIGTPNHIDPNVSFLIDNEVVYNTGDIPKTEQWRQFGFSFVTTSTQSSITLTLRNNAPGGGGNDLALDNISFRPCGPSSFIGIESDTTIFLCIDDEPLTILADIDAGQGQVFAIQWQSSQDGTNWVTLEDSTDNTLVHTNFIPGDYFYRYYSAGNEINILNNKCRIISDEIKLTILPDTYEVADTLCEGLIFPFGNQQLSEAGSYVESFESQYGCDSIVFLDLFFISPKEIIYEDVVFGDPTCFGYNDGFIEVNSIIGGNGDLSYTIDSGTDTSSGASLTSGTYSINVVDKYLCSDVLSIQLFDPPELEVFIGNDTTIKLGDDLILTPDYSIDFETIEWTGQGEFTCSNCPEPAFVPFMTDDLSILVADENGCEARHSIRINVDEENFIILPNIFSPNDDNINDQFSLFYYGRSVAQVNSFSVYDRWGGLIHNINNVMLESGGSLWDGYKNSDKVAQGVYFYNLEVQLINGVNFNKIGDITVLK